MQKDLEFPKYFHTFALEKSLACKLLGSVTERCNLERLNPARVRYTEAQASERGLYFWNDYGEEKSYSLR